MLIQESFKDIDTPTGSMRVFIIEPKAPDYPQAKYPGCVVFSEIYQVTAPVRRFAAQIASQGYIVACPSIFHEFAGTEALPYDDVGTDAGNKYKKQKQLQAYDDDARLTIDLLCALPHCNGRIAVTGLCVGGHLAFRCSFDPRVLGTVCFFPTDIHSESLGTSSTGSSNSLSRIPDIQGEIVVIFGIDDTHVPFEGRTLVRSKLAEQKEKTGLRYSLVEVQAQHAFVRDEASKGRHDAALTRTCFSLMMEVWDRTVVRDMGPRVAPTGKPEHVC